MAASSPCPPADRLRQLLAGTTPTAEQDQLIAHLDDCAICQHLLDQLAGASPALLSAAQALPHNTYTLEAPLRRVLDDIEGSNELTLLTPRHQSAWVQSLLRPAESPELLGWLD